MAFRNDPVVVGLGTKKQATSTPRAKVQRDAGGVGRPAGGAGARPAGGAGTRPAGGDGAKPADPVDAAEECRQAYADFRELSGKTERRWQWISAITGAAGLGLGAAIGVWQARRHAAPALPQSK